MNSYAYDLITEFYGDRTSNRSKVPLINHINEGLEVLVRICASPAAMDAYCLHPLLQHDDALANNYDIAREAGIDSYAILLAMEYRSVANEYLSGKVGTGHIIRLSPLKDVNDMLIADKVQNRKDFIKYHKGTHERSNELDIYFSEWLQALGISEETYMDLCEAMKHANI